MRLRIVLLSLALKLPLYGMATGPADAEIELRLQLAAEAIETSQRFAAEGGKSTWVHANVSRLHIVPTKKVQDRVGCAQTDAYVYSGRFFTGDLLDYSGCSAPTPFPRGLQIGHGHGVLVVNSEIVPRAHYRITSEFTSGAASAVYCHWYFRVEMRLWLSPGTSQQKPPARMRYHDGCI